MLNRCTWATQVKGELRFIQERQRPGDAKRGGKKRDHAPNYPGELSILFKMGCTCSPFWIRNILGHQEQQLFFPVSLCLRMTDSP